MTIQGPPRNDSNHPEPIRGNGSASRAHQVPFTTPLPVDHLLRKLFKYLTRCACGADAVRILPPLILSLCVVVVRSSAGAHQNSLGVNCVLFFIMRTTPNFTRKLVQRQ